MRNALRTLLTPGFLFLLPTLAWAQVDARVWIEEEPDYFRRGERIDVRFAVSDDAYVAVVHVDTEGNLDFVYPSSPWDNEWVRGGEVHSVRSRGGGSPWTVRGSAGIGYFYILASPDPLDFGYFRGRTGSPWDWAYAGRVVRGDPFLAFDQIARMLLPRYPYSPYVFDYYSYYVEGLHRYPTYACSDRYRYDYGWGWTPSYGSCGQLDYFLRDHPYYYDSRRYRGDRTVYLREYDRLDPRHGFKEDPDRSIRGIAPRSAQPRQQPGGFGDDLPRRDAVQPGSLDRPANRQPEGTTERRPAQGVPAGEAARERPAPSVGTRREPAQSDTPAGSSRRPARGSP